MLVEWWVLTATANTVMVVIYAIIATIMIRGIQAGNQWRSNPIAVATAAVFVSCTISHGFHVLHVVPPYSTLYPAQAAAARAMFADPALLTWDAFTAIVAVWYFMMRNRLAIVYQGASLCEDLTERQKQAEILNAKVVEGLATAEAALTNGNREEGVTLLEKTLNDSKEIITTLLGTKGSRTSLGPGDLRREAPSR